MTDHNDHDDQDDFERRLRSGLTHRAERLDTLPYAHPRHRSSARARMHAARRRRMAAASTLTAAAVASGLVFVSRQPDQQPVGMGDAGGSTGGGVLAAGSATGSSSGSASGSPTGWTISDIPAGSVANLPKWVVSDATLGIPAEPTDGVSVSRVMSEYQTSRGTGSAAADLAVAADLSPGSPLRFVVASVQESSRLSPGTGGTTTTIAGRPARIISHRASTVMVWDVAPGWRVLVTAAGVDDATLEAWLTSLSRGADNVWRFGPVDGTAAGGLTATPTITPTTQTTRTAATEVTRSLPDGTCEGLFASVTTTTGGTYELWAAIADQTRWSPTLPEVTSVNVPGVQQPLIGLAAAATGTATLFDGEFVVTINSWVDDKTSAVDPADFAARVHLADDAEWASLVADSTSRAVVTAPDCAEPASVAIANTGEQDTTGPVSDEAASEEAGLPGSTIVPAVTVPGAATMPPSSTVPSSTVPSSTTVVGAP